MSLSWSALHAQLLRSAQRLSFQRQFDLIRIRQPALLGFRDLADLLDHQHRPGGDPAARNAVLAALASEAAGASALADAALLAALLALWPGLDAVYGRLLRHYRGEPDLLVAEMSSRIAEGIRTVDLTRVNRIAATLLRNLERDLRRQLRRSWAECALHSDLLEDLADATAAEPGEGAGALLRDLAGRIGPRDAALVTAIAIEGETPREAAERHGVGYDALRKRYQRALLRLRTDFSR